MSGQIFISYAHVDDLYLGIFERRLKETYDIWTDSQIGLGNEWKESIDAAIRKSFAVLVLLTPNSSESKYVTYEWSYAFGLGRRVITVMLEPTEKFHPRLENLQYIDFSNNDLKSVVEKVKDSLTEDRLIELVDGLSAGWDWSRLTTTLAEEELEFRESGGIGIAMTLLTDGVAKIEDRDYRNALDTLEKAIDFAPQHQLDDIHFQIARAYRGLGNDAGKVKAHLNETLHFNGEHAQAMAMLGDMHRRDAVRVETTDPAESKRLLEKAKVTFGDALNVQPHVLDENNESVHALLGGILKRLNLIPDAIAAYHKATEYRGTSYPYNNLGLLYMQQKQRDKMRANFRLVRHLASNKIRQQDTIDAWSFNDLLVAQIVLEKLDEAQETLETILAIPPAYALQRLLETLEDDMADLPGASSEALSFIEASIDQIRAWQQSAST